MPEGNTSDLWNAQNVRGPFFSEMDKGWLEAEVQSGIISSVVQDEKHNDKSM